MQKEQVVWKVPKKKKPQHKKAIVDTNMMDTDNAHVKPRRKKSAHVVQRSGARKKTAAKRRKLKKKQSSIMLLPLMMVFLMILGGVGYFGYLETLNYLDFIELRTKVDTNTFYPGTTVEGKSVAGMTLEQALTEFTEDESEFANKFGINISYNDKTWKIGAVEAGLGDNVSTMIHRAYNIARYGSLEERNAAIEKLATNGQNFAIDRSYDKNKIKTIANDIANSIDIAAVDASVSKFDLNSKTFTFTESQDGVKGDADKLYNSIIAALDSSKFDSTVKVEVAKVIPSLTKADMEAKFKLVASAQTKTTNVKSRNTNIDIASKAINGIMLKPGETFSFNGTTGKRTKAKGYQIAGVISGGVVTEDIGGGICQVSTTLFNAAAKADLEIVERHPHSIKSSYVNIGLDAAVNWDNQDLKFKNNKSTPIYIIVWYEDRHINAEIYGEALPDGIEIKLDSDEHSSKAPGKPKIIVNKNLKPGTSKVIEASRKGRSSSTYRVYYKDGKEIKKDFMFKSVYPAYNGITEVGPEPEVEVIE